MKTGRIGDLLLSAGIIDAGQLKAALKRNLQFGGRLATHCLALGFATEHALATALSYQLGWAAPSWCFPEA